MATHISPEERQESLKQAPVISGALPFIGHLREYTGDRLGLLRRAAREGDVTLLRFGPFPSPLFNKPEYVQSILVDHAYDLDKSEPVHAVFRSVIGEGIFNSEGDLHRKQRKIMAPSFQPRQIGSYAETMAKYGEQLQREWSDGEIVDINKKMTTVTMSIIGKILFDVDVFNETDELGRAMNTTLEYVSVRLSQLFPPKYEWPLPLNRRAHRAVRQVREHIQQFIDAHRADSDRYNDMLSVLLSARDEESQPMSNEQVMAEAQTLYIAGHETTATALTWCWYLLCQHPEVYRRVQWEVDSVLEGRAPTLADLSRLPYCLQVLKEALRIYPPALLTARQALKDLVIDGYPVAKGQFALIAPYLLHRREEYFPDPERFDPERFTPEREKQIPRHGYMPFGAGPRICIGNHFALMEGQILVATLAQRVTFELVPDQKMVVDPVHHLTLRPANAVNVKVSRRTN